MEPVNPECFHDPGNREYETGELAGDHLHHSGPDEIIKIGSIKIIFNNDYK